MKSEPVSFAGAFKAGGSFMFVVLLLLRSFEELESVADHRVGARDPPDVRREPRHDRVHATASSAFFVLGAVPMGWLADRVKRVPIVGWASLAFGCFVFLSGLR